MATNSSEHLGLHLWEPGDQVLRTEFNQNWSKIDEAVNTAQETAEAVADAYTPDNMPYVIGTYTGTHGNTNASQTITLGFKPSFLIICGNETGTSGSSTAIAGYYAITGGHAYSDVVTLTDTGFKVTQYTNQLPMLTNAGHTYDYIAFR